MFISHGILSKKNTNVFSVVGPSLQQIQVYKRTQDALNAFQPLLSEIRPTETIVQVANRCRSMSNDQLLHAPHGPQPLLVVNEPPL